MRAYNIKNRFISIMDKYVVKNGICDLYVKEMSSSISVLRTMDKYDNRVRELNNKEIFSISIPDLFYDDILTSNSDRMVLFNKTYI